MKVSPFILNEFEAFELDTPVNEVKAFFSETTFTHFPVVDDGILVGLISETDAQCLEESEDAIGNFQNLFYKFYTDGRVNILDILHIFASRNSNIVAAVNEQHEYLGYFELLDVLNVYNESPFFNTEGTYLLLKKEARDFSFSEVSQIAEINKAKIVGIFITEMTDATVEVTLKILPQDLNEVIQSYRRYNYEVLSNHDEDLHIEDLKDRSNYLQKYLNM